jgi:hypothetical protein
VKLPLRPATPLAVVLAAFAAGGCGAQSTQRSSGAQGAAPHVPLTSASSPAGARAFAAGVQLRPGDLPQFSAAAQRQTLGSSSAAVCGLKVSTRGRVAGVRSDRFRSGNALHGVTLEATVEVMRSTARSTAEISSVRSALANAAERRCIAGRLGRAIKAAARRGAGRRVGIADGVVTLAPIRLGARFGGARVAGFSVGYRARLKLRHRAGRAAYAFRTRSDLLYAAVGRTEISLFATATGASPPASLEARLFSLLIARARGAS